jgi:AbrB family looped-hinge helix DNA binding protein
MKSSTTIRVQERYTMEEMLSIVTRKGQITLPAEIRKSLGIKEGDRVAFSLGDPEKAEVVVRPVRSVAEATFGAVSARKQPEDFEELRREFEEGTAQEALSAGSEPQEP